MASGYGTVNDYFRQGYNEYILGYDLTQCPFRARVNMVQRNAWVSGWLAAEADDSREEIAA